MASTLIDKPDIVQVMEGAGAVFRKQGKNLMTCCPLHSEKTPSCKVNPDRQTFHCFGCHEGGDVIEFVMKYKSISFQGAIRELGIDSYRAFKPDPEKERRRRLVSEFRQWEREYFNFTASQCRLINKSKAAVRTVEDVNKLAELYKLESVLGYHMDILTQGNDEAKFELYQETRRMRHNGN